MLFQLQALQQEKEKLAEDLENVYKRHQEELEIQQLSHFQVSARPSAVPTVKPLI